MFCSKCGQENASDARFCSKCGTALTGTTTTSDEQIRHRIDVVSDIVGGVLISFLIGIVGFIALAATTGNTPDYIRIGTGAYVGTIGAYIVFQLFVLVCVFGFIGLLRYIITKR